MSERKPKTGAEAVRHFRDKVTELRQRADDEYDMGLIVAAALDRQEADELDELVKVAERFLARESK